MSRKVEQSVDRGDSHALGPVGDFDDVVAGAYPSFLEHAQVKARPPVSDEQGGHPRLVHPQSDSVASDARLANLQQRLPDTVAIANAHLAGG